MQNLVVENQIQGEFYNNLTDALSELLNLCIKTAQMCGVFVLHITGSLAGLIFDDNKW